MMYIIDNYRYIKQTTAFLLVYKYESTGLIRYYKYGNRGVKKNARLNSE